MSSVQVRTLTKRFGTVTAVFEVSFEVPAGGALAIVGPRRSGKTTILRCLAGLEVPDWGSIECGDETLFDRGRNIDVAPERRGLGAVFQSGSVWPHMTVADNVAFPLKVRGVPPAECLARAGAMLERVGMQGFEQRAAALLSADQQQRVALARALVHDPKLVLFDEALSGLDAQIRRRMRMELRMLQERLGFTAIYATHEHDEAFGLADRIILLNQGAIEAAGTGREMVLRPRSAYVARFLGMNVLEGRLIGDAADPRYLEVELSDRLVIRGIAAPEQELLEGGRVLACIRKEAVRLIRPRPGEAAAGMIVGAAFLGGSQECVVDIAGVRLEAIAQVSGGPDPGLATGERVHVSMTPDDWVFVR